MLEGVWHEERQRWTPDLDLTTTSYSLLCERGEKGKVLEPPRLRPTWRQHWDTLIFDEAHYLKGRNTNWTKAALRIGADQTWLATGTPIPNWAHELFIPAQMLHPGDKRWTSYWRWARHWFNVWQPRWGGYKIGKLLPRYSWDDFARENLGELMLRRTWDDVADQLPPLRRQTIEVGMHPAQARFYREIKKQYLSWLPGKEYVAWSAGAQHSLLIKATTGLPTVQPGEKGSGKLDALHTLLEDWGGGPAIVACHFRATAAAIAAQCEKDGWRCIVATGDTPPRQRFALAKRFQDGEADILVATIEAIAEGLTLTRANRMVFVEKSYRPSRNKQAERRIWRIGQDRPCLVVDLVTKGTVDAKRDGLLERKTDQQMKVLSAKEFAALL